MMKPRELLTPEYHSLCDDLSNLILLSSSKQTWAKHCSAWKLYSEFCSIFRVNFDLPIKAESARAFVAWAASTKNLKSSTIRSYVSSLNMANTLGNSNHPNLNSDSCVKLAIKGVKNSVDQNSAARPSRIPMTYDLLTILGHRINELNWGKFSNKFFGPPVLRASFLRVEWEKFCPFKKKVSIPIQRCCGKMLHSLKRKM